MNDLEAYFRQNQGRTIHKWTHYFEVYERHFSRFRGKDINILEIGVAQGGSLQMWKHYFGNRATIYGVDVNPLCKALEEDNIKIFIGSQSDKQFLRKLKATIPKCDLLIDDGGHTMVQQIVTFEEMFDHVKSDGVYLVEDLHTSYAIEFGGGYRRRGTFIEYSKSFIDYLNAYHSEQGALKTNSFTESVASLHYYDSVLVIEKARRGRPSHEMTGSVRIAAAPGNQTSGQRAPANLAKIFLKSINRALRFLRLPGFIWR